MLVDTTQLISKRTKKRKLLEIQVKLPLLRNPPRFRLASARLAPKRRKIQPRSKQKRKLHERLKKSVSLRRLRSLAKRLKKLLEQHTSLKIILLKRSLNGPLVSESLNNSSHLSS